MNSSIRCNCMERHWMVGFEKDFGKAFFAITNQQRALLNGAPRYLSVFRPSHASSNSVNYHCARPIVRGVRKKIEADKNDRRFDACSSNMAANFRAIALSIAAALWGSRYRRRALRYKNLLNIVSAAKLRDTDSQIFNILHRRVLISPVTSINRFVR